VSSREFQERLARRARRTGLTIRPELGAQLEKYYRLLSTWNNKINLTGLRLSEFSPESLDRLLIEPLVAASHVRPAVRSLLDIGSGGGSPAIPLALALPDVTVLMVEAKTRKSVFLREALRVLDLTRGDVVTSRFEELLTKPRLHEAHDLLTIRAVRIEARVLMSLQAFVRPSGELFLFRTAAGASGPTAVTPPLAWKASYPLLEQASSLVVLEKKAVGYPGRNVSRETQDHAKDR
jgi:16S rRNA (guanine(527)-N(7))-methyltransferase RsmG